MVTGHQGSEDTLGPKGLSERKRRRRKELEEDDSSDLESDDSDEEEKRAAQQIKFSKMPVRGRSGSSPIRGSTLRKELDQDTLQPELMVTSPSRPPESNGLRRGSLGAVEAVKMRSRRDTTTSSEMSSENELDPNAFRRQKIPSRATKASEMLKTRIAEEDHDAADSDLEDEDVGEASDLSDEFEAEPESLLDIGNDPLAGGSGDFDASPIKAPPDIPTAITPLNSSPKKSMKDVLPKLPRLPSNRPISTMQPVSLLSKALKGGDASSNEKPFQRFAELSGKGEASPLWIKIYAPFSERSSKPYEVPLRRQKEGVSVTVAELVGHALWRYNEEELKPPLKDDDRNINRWTLRMVEDEEVDLDFPALGRTRPVTDFTSNNNRPPRARSRDKPWDEFGLVRATDEQFKESEELTPQFGQDSASVLPSAMPTPRLDAIGTPASTPMTRIDSNEGGIPVVPGFLPNRNPITGPSFAPSALRKDSQALLDQPQQPVSHATPRTGAPKTVSVHYTDAQSFQSTLLPIPTTSDTYIAELFDLACKRLNIDKALHVLKVRGTQTVAPSDRTVEALGERLHLDLVRRRFIGGDAFGLGLSGSPGSTSPNAPLLLTTGTTPTKKKKGFGIHPLAATKQAEASTTMLGLQNLTGGGKKYNVIRKQPLSFANSHPRTLIIDGEYMQILPAASGSINAPTGKTTNVHMSSIVGVKVSRKHPKMVRVLVFRERETKRYDFEASSRDEAADIVSEIRKGVAPFAGGVD